MTPGVVRPTGPFVLKGALEVQQMYGSCKALLQQLYNSVAAVVRQQVAAVVVRTVVIQVVVGGSK